MIYIFYSKTTTNKPIYTEVFTIFNTKYIYIRIQSCTDTNSDEIEWGLALKYFLVVREYKFECAINCREMPNSCSGVDFRSH